MHPSLLLTLALTAAAAPALAGPPWISIEFPANPYNASTRDAFCVVHVYHHGDAAYYPVQGTAEGLVNGERRSVPLTLTDAGMPGVYAVRYRPETTGSWMLVFRVGAEGEYGSATALVVLGPDGRIISTTVPTSRRGKYLMPERVTAEAIDRLLHERAG
ncbi:MAG TPA: hypothetical protein VH879_09160 [Gemmatimonadales bacterium]|jgi:hypothetical protein